MDHDAEIANIVLMSHLGLTFIALSGVFFGIALASISYLSSLELGLNNAMVSQLALYSTQETTFIQLYSNNPTALNSSLKNITEERVQVVNSTNQAINKIEKLNPQLYMYIISFASLACGLFIFFFERRKLANLKPD